MALIKCSECGKEISDKAKACIHCGCPIDNKNRKENISYVSKDNNKQRNCFQKALIDFKDVAGSTIIAIAISIAFLVAIPQYIIEKNNCTHGNSTTTRTMSYNNGKVDTNSSEYTMVGLMCRDYESSYMFKLVFRYFIISYIGTSITYIVIKSKKYDKNTISKKEMETSNVFEKHKALIISLIGIGIMLLSLYVLHTNIAISMLFTLIVVIIITLICRKK